MDAAITTLVAASGLTLAAGGLILAQRSADIATTTPAFPTDLTAAQVETLLGSIASLPARSRVALTITGRAGLLDFGIEGERGDLAHLRAALQGVAPGVQLTDGETTDDERPRLRARISWRGSHVLLRRDQREESVAALLGVLRSARRGERLQLRIRLRPVVRPTAPPLRRPRDRHVLERLVVPREELPADQVRVIRSQYGGPLLNARLEVRVWCAADDRARQLLTRVVTVLRSRSGVRGRFSARSHRFTLPGPGTTVAAPELVPLIGWPLEGPAVPGLAFARAPQRLPDAVIPNRGGRCFGVSTWPGMEQRELHQPAVGALSHSLILGPTGSGKSALLTRLMLDDIDAGRGLLLIDMKGDTALDLLARVPEHRHADVVVLDPSDERPVPGLKALSPGAPDLAADLWVGVFRNLFADSWGVRSERYIRLGVQLLAQDTAAITDLPRVFHDVAFRRRLLAQAADPVLAAAWASFESLSPSQQSEHLSAPLGKVQDLVGRRVVRAVLGQARPRITIAEAMRQRRIVIVRLSPGLLGPPTAQLLGALTVYELYQAVMARQALPEAARRSFGAYIDEPAVMQLAGVPLDALYELARGMGVGITTATQSVSQLPSAVQSAVLTNAATLASFRASRRDAQVVAAELTGMTADELQHLGQYEIVVRLGLRHGQVASVATARTLPPPPATVNVTRLRDEAARRYGVTARDTEAAMRQRWRDEADGQPDDAPIGRRRRAS